MTETILKIVGVIPTIFIVFSGIMRFSKFRKYRTHSRLRELDKLEKSIDDTNKLKAEELFRIIYGYTITFEEIFFLVKTINHLEPIFQYNQARHHLVYNDSHLSLKQPASINRLKRLWLLLFMISGTVIYYLLMFSSHGLSDFVSVFLLLILLLGSVIKLVPILDALALIERANQINEIEVIEVDQEREKTGREYINAIQAVVASNSEAYDTTIRYISISFLTITMVFISRVIPLEKAILKPILFLGWLSILVTIITNISSFLWEQHHSSHQIKLAEQCYFKGIESACEELYKSKNYTHTINYITGGSFIIGITLIVIYTIINSI